MTNGSNGWTPGPAPRRTGRLVSDLVQPTPPPISDAQAAALARETFGIEARARSLGSHQDRNFLLQSAFGRSLLKIANPGTSVPELLAQSRAAAHLAERERGLRAPLTRPGPDGSLV